MIRGRERFLTKLYAFSDFVVIQSSFLLAWILKFKLFHDGIEGHLPLQDYWFWSLVYGAIAIAVGYSVELYVPKRKNKFSNELSKVLQVHTLSMFILLSVLFTFKIVDVSRTFLLLYFFWNLILISVYRYVVKQSLRTLRKKGFNKQFVLIVGAGSIGRKYYETLRMHPEFGLEVVGFLDDFRTEHVRDKLIIGKTSDLEHVLSQQLIDEVIVALPLQAYPKYREIIMTCEKMGVRASIIPDFHDMLPAAPHFEVFGDLPIINVRDVPLDELKNRILKRLFDIAFSLTALTLTSPVMLLIAIGIKLTSPGPIIFKQERVGLNRRTFYMYKFRSMKHLPQEISDTQWTVENDPRRTKFGAFLRRTSLDELPQFFNVLKGDMSVVGPRPERPYFVDKFKDEIPKYMIKHLVRPGITGWAQVCGLRGDTCIRSRIEHDIFYIENWSLLFDIKIIFKTISNGLVNKNAY
ncbi:undecaprenyl-phosphate glucose phosphotransferase [Anoxybacillus flavithermus]|uniref:undecaprenyl-phosphate glucose phosphotransferase n=1 Tax=Anoxybacillus flavithermus TaxID=33934 RepID=UPI0010093CF9|nr:undecaprenyl-phosphate glucose phosphotransferase [Anoxybacillus flavithermus]QAV25734.1 undecaprenyl-phosphate glucose phosphotransferase [Neobacillus thermocopriae]MBE2940078.1 undecaprenyl-phosphate glucose phosphotransferase [Anoxybacillus flavithermus]MBE2942831.1 undecaprenyl-phosphate glucose phosphotransferase [Anoxybacillus flavithermus]MBE2951183.1 undecaprenyl-phosphate glucose phosphotransferase [Anoxybacillus flavithermus]MBE2953819.1 undecaprenyl-phosphate glucose phosphotrans